MVKNVRLTANEQENLYRTTVTLNRELVRLGKMPIKESELVHQILEQTLNMGEIELTRDGQVRVLANTPKKTG